MKTYNESFRGTTSESLARPVSSSRSDRSAGRNDVNRREGGGEGDGKGVIDLSSLRSCNTELRSKEASEMMENLT